MFNANDELSRAGGGGLPAASSLSTPLPHAPLSQRKSVPGTSTQASTQTSISVLPNENFITFSAKTCRELLPKLTKEQLDFEIKYNNEVLGRKIEFRARSPSENTKLQALDKIVGTSITSEFEDIFYECSNYQALILDFSRAVDKAKGFINELLQRGRRGVNDEDDDDQFFDAVEVPRPDSSEFPLPDPVRVLDDFKFEADITLEDVCRGVDFVKLGDRQVAHFGNTSYGYGKTKHPPRPYPENALIDHVFKSLSEHLGDPDFNKSTYGCLFTYYAGGKNSLAFHSDDEDSITPGSDIITVSFGQTRSIVFQNTAGPLRHRQSYSLEHGSVHIMSQHSQSFWAHSIPADDSSCGPRVSLTFRKLRLTAPPAPQIPPIRRPDPDVPSTSPSAQISPTNAHSAPAPKRLLLLSDSIHLSFPTEKFKNPDKLVCIKKRLYQVTQLHQYESEFSYTDYVFISSGINDLSRYNLNGREVFEYIYEKLNSYRVLYPNTVFIFNSILTTSHGDWLNIEINKVNHDMFYLSLESKMNCNLWFFDSHHIAYVLSRNSVPILDKRGNGVHLTHTARVEIWAVIYDCIQGRLNGRDVGGIWPLRGAFRHYA